MASFDFDAPAPKDGPQFLEHPGKHLLEITAIDAGKNMKGEPIADGFTVKTRVVGSETAAAIGSTAGILCRRGRGTDKHPDFFDGRVRAIGVATGQIDPQMESGRASLDLDAMVGCLFVAEFEKSQDGKFTGVRFNNIWHVDDSKALGLHLDMGLIDKIPAQLRRKPEDFRRTKAGESTPKKSAFDNL